MKLYFGGAEVPSHRRWLGDAGITDVYLSYVGLRRRVKKYFDRWLIADRIPPGMSVLLDSGAYTVNKQESELSHADLAAMAASYMEFVTANAERAEAVTEFDALALGLDWVEEQRAAFYDDLGDKFMPVWHPEYGVGELESLAARYRRIGILRTSLGDRDIIPVLNMLAQRRGTLLHGIAMTKPDIMREVRWDSVGSTSWLSPIKYGETHVWNGRELKWYPKDYKEQARKRHRTLFTMAGFDPGKIAAGDTEEIVRLTLWSWGKLMDDINGHRKPTGQVQDSEPEPTVQSVGFEPEEVMPDASTAPAEMHVPGVQREAHVTEAPGGRAKILLPGVSLVTTTEGQEFGVRGDNLRRCDSCFLRERNCPGYQPGADCLYEFPIKIASPADLKRVETGMLELQTQRVMFLRMVEDLEGGYPDPNMSAELDRLTRMIKAHRDGTMIREKIVFESNRPGEVGAISRLFGDDVAAAQQIEAPNPVDSMIRESMYLKGEVVE